MANSFYYDLLKMRRKAMGAGNRKKSKNSRLPNWLYPYALERQYSKRISEIMKQFISIVDLSDNQLNNWIAEFSIKKDSFSSDWAQKIVDFKDWQNQIFGDNVPENLRTIISTQAFSISDFNLEQWKKISGKIFGIDLIQDESWETEVINSWGNENFELIKSLSDEYIKKVNLLVSDAVKFGKTASEIKKAIKLLDDNITNYRSKLIARDQVGKLNGLLTQRRQAEAEIDKYIWLTAGDERVRSTHREMSGKICRWDNPDVMSSDGVNWVSRSDAMTGAIPGSQIQCRCSATPYMNDIYGDIDKELEG